MKKYKLYKLDSKGKLRFLELFAENGEVVQISGLVEGKATENRSKCTPKNIGKSNETSAEEQAEKEVESKYLDKLTKGYFSSVHEAETNKVILPMLAKDAKKEMHKIEFPCYVQPKLDGMRSLGSSKSMMSRTGKPITTMDHILKQLEDINVTIDGELYAHGLSFQDNMKLIKKYREGETEKVHYHVYDIISDLPFGERYKQLFDLCRDMDNIEIVPSYFVNSMEEIRRYHTIFLEEGYEGTMIRWGKEGYKLNGRSSNLLKYKDFIDITAKVLDIVPMEKRPEQGMALCELSDGGVFTANFKMPFAKREEILTDKAEYIGQTAEIRFFEYTDDGLPRFPVCVGFRLDK